MISLLVTGAKMPLADRRRPRKQREVAGECRDMGGHAGGTGGQKNRPIAGRVVSKLASDAADASIGKRKESLLSKPSLLAVLIYISIFQSVGPGSRPTRKLRLSLPTLLYYTSRRPLSTPRSIADLSRDITSPICWAGYLLHQSSGIRSTSSAQVSG